MKNIGKLGAILAAGAVALSGCQSIPMEVREGLKAAHKMRYVSDKENYGTDEYIASVNEIKAKGNRDDCDGIAYIVAAELKKQGHRPLVLEMYRDVTPLDNLIAQNPQAFGMRNVPRFASDEKRIGHAVAVYEKDGGYWAIDGNKVRGPKDTINELVRSLKMWYDGSAWDTFALQNLDQIYPDGIWLSGKGNLLAYRNKNIEGVAQSDKK